MIEESYRKMSGINQSMLKELPKNPHKVKQHIDGTLVEEVKSYYTFGSMVDVLLTESLKQYKSKFVVCNDYPTDSIKDVIDKTIHYIKEDFYASPLATHILNDDLSTYTDELLKAMNECEYQTNWKQQTRINKITTLGTEYFKFCLSVENKTIVSVLDNSQAMACYMGVTSDEGVKNLLSKGTVEHKKVIQFMYRGVECKCELDGIVIDHDRKRIIPFDYKTTGDRVLSFGANVFKYGYDIQAMFYTLALKSEYPDYTIHPFRFIVVNRLQPNKPVVFKISKQVMTNALNGYIKYNTWKKGINDLIDTFSRHVELGKWDYPIEWYDNKELTIDYEV